MPRGNLAVDFVDLPGERFAVPCRGPVGVAELREGIGKRVPGSFGRGEGGEPQDWRTLGVRHMGGQGGIDPGCCLVAEVAGNPSPLFPGILRGSKKRGHLVGHVSGPRRRRGVKAEPVRPITQQYGGVLDHRDDLLEKGCIIDPAIGFGAAGGNAKTRRCCGSVYIVLARIPFQLQGQGMTDASDSIHVMVLATAELAVPTLDALVDVPWIGRITVVSQPDRPQGRRRKLAPSPVRARAEALGLTVLTPEKIGSPDSVAALADLAPDVMAVFAYGQYLPRSVVSVPRLGAINIHPSLLPRWRGASPIQHTVLHGDPVAGVSIIGVAEAMDAGDVYAQEEVAIEPEERADALGTRLAARGTALLIGVIDALRKGCDTPRPQGEDGITECRKLAKEDGLINWEEPAEAIQHQIRGLYPWPGSYTSVPGWDGPLKVHGTQVEALAAGVVPGTVVDVAGPGPLVACGEGALRLIEVQPPGKKAMAGDAFLRGAHWETGVVLGKQST